MTAATATAAAVRAELRRLGNAAIAAHARGFFKTGKGEYGEGDKFLGVRVPVVRKLVRRHRGLTLSRALALLRSAFHEERLFALLWLVQAYQRGSEEERRKIYTGYLNNTRHINNWDLVDVTAHHIVGAHLAGRSRKPLYRLAKSKSLWERRIAMMATFYLIRKDDFTDALKIARMLRDDREDLIHKSVGWMLREIGKRDLAAEEKFLRQHHKKMPRTMLRYAIEKFPERKRRRYLRGMAG